MTAATSKVLTLVFTDLADSTALKSARGDYVVDELLTRHRDHVTRLAEECAGRIIDWAGDGCFLTFDTSSAGVMFALQLQKAHSDESDLPGVRIGIHLGEVTERPGPDGAVQVKGLAVDVAARIEGLAKPGQVLMSSSVYNSARQRMGVEAMGMPLLWQLHGTYALKGFDVPLDIAEAGIQGVAPLEAPKTGGKARLVRKAKKQPEKFEQPASRGVPLWAFALVVIVLGAAIAYLAMRPSFSRRGIMPDDARIESIAVLPFDNYSGDETQDYFVNGMTDTLTAELAKIKSIKVMARTSAMRYKNTEKQPDEIARELGVQGLIEGSIQRNENEVLITAQLIDGRTNEHVWAGNFDGTVENILKLQGEIAVAIAEELDAVLAPEERAKFEQAKDVNPAAWEFYLEAREAFRLRTVDGLTRTIDLLKGAIAADPDFAEAHALLGWVHSVRPINFEEYPRSDEVRLAKTYADRALELDSDSIEARFALAFVALQDNWDWNAYLEHTEAALAHDSNNDYATFLKAYRLQLIGQFHEGLRFAEMAVALDPLYPLFHQHRAVHLLTLERYDDALAGFRHTGELSPGFPGASQNIPVVLAAQGKAEEAIAALADVVVSESEEGQEDINALVYARLGMKAEAEAALSTIAERWKVKETIRSFLALALLGREEAALDQLETLLTVEHDPTALQRVHWLGWDNPLWENGRTWEILESINVPHFPPEHPAHKHQQTWLRKKAAEEVLAAQPKPVQRYSILLHEDVPIVTSSGLDNTMDLAPNGSALVYIAQVDGKRMLALRHLDSFETTVLKGTEDAGEPTFSPDSQWIAYPRSLGRGLYKVHVDGGPPIQLAEDAWRIAPIWDESGYITYHARLGNFAKRVHETGGEVEELNFEGIDVNVGGAIGSIQNGSAYLVTTISSQGSDVGSVYVADQRSGTARLLVENIASAQLLPSGHLAYTQRDQLIVVPFNAEQLELAGPPVVVSDDITPGFAVSASGSVIYRAGLDSSVEGQDRLLVWVERNGDEEPLPWPAPAPFHLPRISPDGALLAIGHDDMDIWVHDLANRMANRLTLNPLTEYYPLWSSDGSRVLFASTPAGATVGHIHWKAADGTGDMIALSEPGAITTPQAWTPDGQTLVYTQINSETSYDVGVLETAADNAQRILLNGAYEERHPTVSPGGDYIAYTSTESGDEQVYVRPFPDVDASKWQISTIGGSEPFWSRDSAELFYRDGDRMMAVPVRFEPTFSKGDAVVLFEKRYFTDYIGSTHGRTYDVSPTDGRFLMIKELERTRRSELRVIENWFEELERIAPHPEAN